MDMPSRSVVVPVANPETAPQLVHLGARIAEKESSALILLHVEPGASPYASEATLSPARAPDLDRVRTYAAGCDVRVETLARAAPTVADGIIRETQSAHVDYLVMGWRGEAVEGKTRIGSNIDQVIKASSCHTVVMQQGTLDEAERLLVPIANPHAAPLALAVATLIHTRSGPDITVLHLAPVALDETQRETFRRALFAYAVEAERGPQALFTDVRQFEVVFEVQDDPARELAARSARFDRMIIGTSRGGYSGHAVFDALQLHIARSSRCPVVFVRPKERGPKYRY